MTVTKTLPQPPPNAPPPPPSEAALRSQRWWKWMLVVGIGSIVLLMLAALMAPAVVRTSKKANLAEAINNLRCLGLALFEFEAAYGAFPNDQTAAAVKSATSTSLSLGSSTSNDYFRQLIAAEVLQTEVVFYAKTRHGKKPDNLITGSKALEKGECAFAYIVGLTAKSPEDTPIVVFPLVPGKRTFDRRLCDKYFHGKAVVLRVDNSVMSYPVDASGRVWIDGKDLFDPTQPFWGGTPPRVAWPEW